MNEPRPLPLWPPPGHVPPRPARVTPHLLPLPLSLVAALLSLAIAGPLWGAPQLDKFGFPVDSPTFCGLL